MYVPSLCHEHPLSQAWNNCAHWNTYFMATYVQYLSCIFDSVCRFKKVSLKWQCVWYPCFIVFKCLPGALCCLSPVWIENLPGSVHTAKIMWAFLFTSFNSFNLAFKMIRTCGLIYHIHSDFDKCISKFMVTASAGILPNLICKCKSFLKRSVYFLIGFLV